MFIPANASAHAVIRVATRRRRNSLRFMSVLLSLSFVGHMPEGRVSKGWTTPRDPEWRAGRAPSMRRHVDALDSPLN